MHHDTILIPVILSGGTGTRLWPVSRESHPKPFIKLADGQSLLQKTFLRASMVAKNEVITITNKDYYLKSKAEYAEVSNSTKTSFILEPFARNTAAAIAFAALKIQQDYGLEACLLILPADHLINDSEAFKFQVDKAIELAQQNLLVTFGIKPSYAETGFGYIECGESLAINDCYDAKRFVEKPTLEVAQHYLQSDLFLWNAGMFCFKTSTLLEALSLHAPDVLTAAQECFSKSQHNNSENLELDAATFKNVPSISIDYALMEKATNVAVVACQYDWQDLGSWEAYKQLHGADSSGNTILGNAIMIDSYDNLIHSDHRIVASIGVNQLAVIDTPDALLITHRDRTQDVKQVVQALKDKAHETYLMHRTVTRPWGTYTVLEEGPSFKIKRIVVKPKHSLSLQLHQHRSEHWVVVEGCALVVNGEREYELNKNESTFLPMGVKHRLTNPSDHDLIIIEVQTGQYLGEDDIVRFDDVYGRVAASIQS